MALTTTISKVTYVGNGSTTSFSVPFKFIEDSDIVVKILTSTTETAWVDGTDYTLSGAGVDSGGTLTATAAPAATDTILIYRTVSLLQSLDLVLTGSFNSQNVEDRFDLIYMLIQQLTEGIAPGSSTENLYLKFPDGEPSATSSTLPNLADRLGNVLSFDPVTGEPTVTDIDLTAVGGFTGPAAQVVGNLAIFSSTQGVAEQDNNIHRSLFDQQIIGFAGTTTWDLDLGHIATITLGAGAPTVLSMDNIKAGVCKLIVVQDSTGGRTINFSTGFSNTDAVSLNTDSSATTVLTFTSDGTNVIYEGSSQAAVAAAGDVGSYKDFAWDFSAVEDDVGYLECDGQAVSRTKYADLFSRLSTTYGIGDGSTTFNLPDLKTDGRFRRNYDGTTAVGATQLDTTAKNGLTVTESNALAGKNGWTSTVNQANTGTDLALIFTGDDLDHNHSVALGAGDAETRPNNIICMVGVKF